MRFIAGSTCPHGPLLGPAVVRARRPGCAPLCLARDWAPSRSPRSARASLHFIGLVFGLRNWSANSNLPNETKFPWDWASPLPFFQAGFGRSLTDESGLDTTFSTQTVTMTPRQICVTHESHRRAHVLSAPSNPHKPLQLLGSRQPTAAKEHAETKTTGVSWA
jgi:hypothetical protein